MLKEIQLVSVWGDDSNDLISAIVYSAKEDIKTLDSMLTEATRRTPYVDYAGWQETNAYSPNIVEEDGMQYFIIDFDNVSESGHRTSVRDVVEVVEQLI